MGLKRTLPGRLLGCRRGSAAVEGALLIPMLVLVLLGMVELSLYLEATRKAMSATQTVADLVAQETEVDDDTLADIRVAAALIMNPLELPPTGPDVTIASIGFDDSAETEVLWTSPDGAVVDADKADGLGSADESVIMVELAYTYDSPFGFLFQTRTMNEDSFARPRIRRRIDYN